MEGRNGRRVAVTGIGVVAACGTGRDAYWQGLLAPAPVGDRRGRRLRPDHVVRKPEGGASQRSVHPVRRSRPPRWLSSSQAIRVTTQDARVYSSPPASAVSPRWKNRRSPFTRRVRARIAVPGPDDDGERRFRLRVDAFRLARTVRDHGHRVRRVHARHSERGPLDHMGALRCSARRWFRSGDHSARHAGLHQHDRARRVRASRSRST